MPLANFVIIFLCHEAQLFNSTVDQFHECQEFPTGFMRLISHKSVGNFVNPTQFCSF